MKLSFDVDRINQQISAGKQEFVAACEHAYDSRIRKIADEIRGNIDSHRLVLMSGPSSSGKTTTSRKLAAYLREYGVDAHTISMDDFFLDNCKTPLGRNGKPDVESVHALDLELMQSCMNRLMAAQAVEMPRFDFAMGVNRPGYKTLKLGEADIVVLEGIHALNDLVVERMPSDKVFKLYISVSSSFSKNGRLFLQKRDVRLLRRLVRDHKYRNATAAVTFGMWPGVCEGEETYVLPFKRHADIAFDSTFPYDPSVIEKDAIPLLSDVLEDARYRDKAESLIEKLKAFTNIEAELVPHTSLMREFIGDSSYYSKPQNKADG